MQVASGWETPAAPLPGTNLCCLALFSSGAWHHLKEAHSCFVHWLSPKRPRIFTVVGGAWTEAHLLLTCPEARKCPLIRTHRTQVSPGGKVTAPLPSRGLATHHQITQPIIFLSYLCSLPVWMCVGVCLCVLVRVGVHMCMCMGRTLPPVP